MAIQSDTLGADSRLSVRFYKRAIKNDFKTQEQGRPIFEEKLYIKIAVPGDNLSEIDRPMYNEDKVRFSQQWFAYQNTQDGEESFVGTPLKEWPLITTSQAEELKGIKFRTVEDVANCSDLQLQRIGMIAGMSPHGFRDKAKQFLNLATETAEVAQKEAEMQALREENAKIKAETDAKLAQMQEQMSALLAAVAEKTPKQRKNKVVEA